MNFLCGSIACITVQLWYTSVHAFQGCCTMMRSDYGTENGLIATMQMALRHAHTDRWAGVNSYKYGKSTSNTVGSVIPDRIIVAWFSSMACLLTDYIICPLQAYRGSVVTTLKIQNVVVDLKVSGIVTCGTTFVL